MAHDPRPPADRLDDLTAEALGGSEFELAAFKVAVMQYILRGKVDDWTALAVIWNGGDWRPMVADFAEEHWHIARRLTKQQADGRPLVPFPDRAGGPGSVPADSIEPDPPGTPPRSTFLPPPPPPAPEGWEYGMRRRRRRRGAWPGDR